jgi:hypothetical protein
VLFINADRDYREGRAQNYLEPEHIEKIVSAYRTFADVPGFARVVSRSELAENDDNLNIRRYVDTTPDPEPQDAGLMDLASPSPSAWPIVRAISARLLSQPTSTLLEALATAGSEAKVDMPSVAQQLPVDYLDALLRGPGRYPAAWVIAAERWRSIQHDEVPLDQVALEEKWLPKVPRL